MASSVLKNDQTTPGGATTPAAIVKRETEHSQGTETPGDRHESSGSTSVVYSTFSRSAACNLFV